jgi:hypothetical protein
VWLIDHGAAVYRQHATADLAAEARRPFPAIRDHVLLPRAGSVAAAHARLARRVDPGVVDAVPGEWLVGPDREAYRSWLADRLAWGGFAAEADDGR